MWMLLISRKNEIASDALIRPWRKEIERLSGL